MKKNQKQAGITLIALVITIIVLLILAGVSIATLVGENGILTQAQNSKTESEIAREKEEIRLAYNAAKIEALGKEVTAAGLNSQFTLNEVNAQASGEETIRVIFNDSKREYTIQGNKIIEELGGAGDEGGEDEIDASNIKITYDVIGSTINLKCKISDTDEKENIIDELCPEYVNKTETELEEILEEKSSIAGEEIDFNQPGTREELMQVAKIEGLSYKYFLKVFILTTPKEPEGMPQQEVNYRITCYQIGLESTNDEKELEEQYTYISTKLKEVEEDYVEESLEELKQYAVEDGILYTDILKDFIYNNGKYLITQSNIKIKLPDGNIIEKPYEDTVMNSYNVEGIGKYAFEVEFLKRTGTIEVNITEIKSNYFSLISDTDTLLGNVIMNEGDTLGDVLDEIQTYTGYILEFDEEKGFFKVIPPIGAPGYGYDIYANIIEMSENRKMNLSDVITPGAQYKLQGIPI